MKHNPIIRFIITTFTLLLPVLIGVSGATFFGWDGKHTFLNCILAYIVALVISALIMIVWSAFFADDYYLWKKEQVDHQSERLNDDYCKRTTRNWDDSHTWDDF